MTNNKNQSYEMQSSNIYKSPPELIKGKNNLKNSLFTNLIKSKDNYFTIKNYGFNNDSLINNENYQLNVQSLNDCINECNSIENCQAYSYYDNSNKCNLYDDKTTTLEEKDESLISGYNTIKEMNASNLDMTDIRNIQKKIGAEYLIQKNNDEMFENKSNNYSYIENFIGDSLNDCIITTKNLKKIKIQVEIDYNIINTNTNFNKKDIYKLCLRYNSSTIECFEKDINNTKFIDVPYINNKKKFKLNLSLTGSKINNIQLFIGNQSIKLKNIKMFFYIGNLKIIFAQQEFNKLLKIGYHTLYFTNDKDFTNLKIKYNGNTEYINLMNDMTLNRISGYAINNSCDISKIPNININKKLNKNFNNTFENKILNNNNNNLFFKQSYKYNQYKDKLNNLFNLNNKSKNINQYYDILDNLNKNDNESNIEQNFQSLINENFKNKCDSSYFKEIIIAFIIILIIGILLFIKFF